MVRSLLALNAVALASLCLLGDIGSAAGAQVVDPAVIGLKVAVIKRLSATTAEIEIVGIVQNIGTKAFSSRKGQQSVRLFEQTPGAKARVILERGFMYLKAGQKNSYRYTMRWDLSWEFPPDYTFQIDYDPDIRTDGNRNNDDENPRNNRKSVKGGDLHKLVSEAIGR